jgi:hypothetical protein
MDSTFAYISPRATEDWYTNAGLTARGANSKQMHSLIIGATGTGKSTLMLDELLRHKGGFILIDPNETLAHAIADRVDCIYFDPTEVPIGLNLLNDAQSDMRKHLTATNVVSIFKARFNDFFGPRMQWLLHNVLILAMDNQLTILDIPRILTDKHFRRWCLRKASYSPYWRQEFEAWTDKERNEWSQPVLNKLGLLSVDPTLRVIFGQQRCLKLRRILDGHRRLVVSLPKSRMGEIPVALLGSFLVSAIFQAAQSRMPERGPQFKVFIDEWPNFITEHFGTILAEARKFNLHVTLAQQNLSQTPTDLMQTVLGNVGSIACFRISPKDAEVLAPHFNLHEADTVSHGHGDHCDLGFHTARVLSNLPNFVYWENDRYPPRPQCCMTSPPAAGNGRLRANMRQTISRYVTARNSASA